MAMTMRRRAATAVALGVVLLALVVPWWWQYFATGGNGRTLLGFYLPLTAVFGVPGALLLVLGVLVLRKDLRR